MIINDEGYIINLRRHGEKSLILTLLTKEHGKIIGYAKNCLSPKNLGIYQQGNSVHIEAYARIEENMWNLRVELLRAHAAEFIVSPAKLAVLSSLCSLCSAVMPEGQPIENLYQYVDNFFNFINEDNWLTHYCSFEFYLMNFLGISLDLEKCSVTGSYDNLRYISPKTGNAVCAEVGYPYRDKLYDYPAFILQHKMFPSLHEVKNLLQMTEFFMKKNFFKTHDLKFPPNRDSLLKNLDLG